MSEIGLGAVHLLEFPVLIIDMETILHFLKLYTALLLRGDHIDGVRQGHLGLALEFVLQLFHFGDATGVDHVDLALHEFVEEGVLCRDAVLEEVTEVLHVLLEVVVGRVEGGETQCEDLLRVACVVV
jgi:hypothetical protein